MYLLYRYRMENKGDIENQSEESVGDTKLRVVTKRGGGAPDCS